MSTTPNMQVNNGNITLNVTATVTAHFRDNQPTYLINFYDSRYPHTAHGQFISNYLLETLQESTTGVILDRGSPDWFINKAELEQVMAWSQNLPNPQFNQ